MKSLSDATYLLWFGRDRSHADESYAPNDGEKCEFLHFRIGLFDLSWFRCGKIEDL